MKKQQKTYILLVVVILIWSVVGFQFFGYLNAHTEDIPEINYKKFTPKATQKKERYKVAEHTRDPFLDKYKSVAKKKTTSNRKKVSTIPFPNTSYQGIVMNKNSKSFIVTINGNQHIMKTGSVINGVKLVSGNSNTIRLRYQGQTKTVTK
ncbi:hypothetical protein [Tenacibaculum agarivorans]|uniref:hypothetical protein n=1 Tax=Tenacibaculum agarivorans TaxID=1908389 RepID=UPI00094BB187|nr:hypothetical protein [Tenacibaculum agarivorans]